MKKKETKNYLRQRWGNEYREYRDIITEELKKKGSNISKLNVPFTKEGFVDLRGFNAPKIDKEGTLSYNLKKSGIAEGLRIDSVVFEKVDLSLTDFDMCRFVKCTFSKVKIDNSRFWASTFWGCLFEESSISRSYLGASTFNKSSILLPNRKNNFVGVTFENTNLSNVVFIEQNFRSCQFINCKTGFMKLSSCNLRGLKFEGIIRNIFISDNTKAQSVNLTEAIMDGVQFRNTSLSGFQFPSEDVYYKSKNLLKELDDINFPKEWSESDIQIGRFIIEVLKTNRRPGEEAFIDIHFLNDEKSEIGKKLLKLLKG